MLNLQPNKSQTSTEIQDMEQSWKTSSSQKPSSLVVIISTSSETDNLKKMKKHGKQK